MRCVSSPQILEWTESGSFIQSELTTQKKNPNTPLPLSCIYLFILPGNIFWLQRESLQNSDARFRHKRGTSSFPSASPQSTLTLTSTQTHKITGSHSTSWSLSKWWRASFQNPNPKPNSNPIYMRLVSQRLRTGRTIVERHSWWVTANSQTQYLSLWMCGPLQRIGRTIAYYLQTSSQQR